MIFFFTSFQITGDSYSANTTSHEQASINATSHEWNHCSFCVCPLAVFFDLLLCFLLLFVSPPVALGVLFASSPTLYWSVHRVPPSCLFAWLVWLSCSMLLFAHPHIALGVLIASSPALYWSARAPFLSFCLACLILAFCTAVCASPVKGKQTFVA